MYFTVLVCLVNFTSIKIKVNLNLKRTKNIIQNEPQKILEVRGIIKDSYDRKRKHLRNLSGPNSKKERVKLIKFKGE